MKVVFEHSGVLPVRKYGGTERVMVWLMQHLVRRGHRVVLIGNPASDVARLGVELIARAPDQDWRECLPRDTDVLHLFATPGAEPALPYMVTIHGNGRPGERFRRNTVFLSRDHATRHGATAFVYNGIAFEEYPLLPAKRVGWERMAFLAKGSWKVKNLRDCVRACRAAGRALEIAGGRSAWSLVYPRIRSHGMVDDQRKVEIFSRSDALLFPVRWHEPFGIAVVEAMAMGLPVLASPYGSLPELVAPSRGRICRTYAELAAAVQGPRDPAWDPARIREEARARFSAEVMTERYLDCYAKVRRGQALNVQEPATLSNESAETLLRF